MDLHPDLMDLLAAFSSSNVEYLVIGGWAVSVHSEPRFTKDLDLLIGTADDNLQRAAQALKLFGAPESMVTQARALGPDEFLFFGVLPARVDLGPPVSFVIVRPELSLTRKVISRSRMRISSTRPARSSVMKSL